MPSKRPRRTCLAYRKASVPPWWYTLRMPSTTPRIQVTLDPELAGAVAELGGAEPRSRTVRDLALRGAEAIRAERHQREEALEFLRRLDAGEDDRFDFSVSEQLRAERR
jgi:hypothetical protein